MTKYNKFLALLLVVSIILCNSFTNISAQETDTQTFASDIEYEVDDIGDDLVLTTEEDRCIYETIVTEDEDINITSVRDGLFKDTEIYDYSIEVINCDLDNNILEYNVIDNNSGEVTHVNDSEELTLQLPIAVGGGIALGKLIVDALIATAVVAVIGGVTYYAVSKVIAKVKEESKKKKKYYYYAKLINRQLCIGSAFQDASSATVYAKACLNNSTSGVFCVGSSAGYNASYIARMASPVFRSIHDTAHKNSEGYYSHHHAAKKKTGTSHYALHVWYN